MNLPQLCDSQNELSFFQESYRRITDGEPQEQSLFDIKFYVCVYITNSSNPGRPENVPYFGYYFLSCSFFTLEYNSDYFKFK